MSAFVKPRHSTFTHFPSWLGYLLILPLFVWYFARSLQIWPQQFHYHSLRRSPLDPSPMMCSAPHLDQFASAASRERRSIWHTFSFPAATSVEYGILVRGSRIWAPYSRCSKAMMRHCQVPLITILSVLEHVRAITNRPKSWVINLGVRLLDLT